MFTAIRNAALSALIALGTLAAPAAAKADGLYFSFGGPNGPQAGIHVSDRDYRRGGRHERRHEYAPRRDDRYERDRRSDWQRRDYCSPAEAVRKASRLGLRRAQVAHVNRQSVSVRGFRHGDRIRVAFARAPGCPVIR